MRRFIPDSVAARTLVVLLFGLTLSHVASTMLLSSDRHAAIFEVSERLCADRVAVFARLLDGTEPADRVGLAERLNSPLLAVEISASAGVAGDHEDGEHLANVRDALAIYFGPVAKDRLHVTYRQTSADAQQSWPVRFINGFPTNRAMDVAFQLSDGNWANFQVAMVRSTQLWSPHAVSSTIVMMIGIVILSFWAAAWIAFPLKTFAKAADRLGRHVTAPPLPEDGPMEVRRAISAFNEMQARIRRFVDDRTRMLAAISHDLRSPITRMRLRTEMLDLTDYRSRTLGELDEMEAMVASTLEFARGESVAEEAQSIDLAAMIGTICDNVTDMGLAAEFEWDRRIVCVCRPLSIKRALTNLVENAARYGQAALVKARYVDGHVEILIDDIGPGIPLESQEKVFSPFFRLEQSRSRKTGGMGLGLTVARTIIRAHGGDIRLDNRPQGGLRVTVTLPQDISP